MHDFGDITSDRLPAIASSCRDFDRWFPSALARLADMLTDATGHVALHPQIDSKFPDGETYVELPPFREGTPVFLHQALVDNSGGRPDAALFSLMIAARAYRQYGAGPITVIVPFLAYARQDRVIRGQRRPTTSGLIADLLSAAGVDRVVTIKSGSSLNLSLQFPTLALRQIGLVSYLAGCASRYDPDSTILVAPDAGALADVRAVAAETGHEVFAADKIRLNPDLVQLRPGRSSPSGRFRHALVLDDLVSSAGTACAAFDAMRQTGIERFSIAAPHCRLTRTGQERLDALAQTGELVRFHTTDTIPTAWHSPVLEVDPFLSAFDAELRNIIQEPFGAFP